MQTTVIVPPEPIVLPENIPGVSANDPIVAAMIAAVTGDIDGPMGWVGRAFGPQTLELSLECWRRSISLPFPPTIDIVGISYTDIDGVEQTVDEANYGLSGSILWFQSGWAAPALGCYPNPVRIRFEAGYNGDDVVDGGTGPIPAQVTQAIIMSVQHMRSLSKDDLFLKVDEVDGIGRREYTVSETAGNIIRNTAERLLQGLRIYSV